MPQGIRKKSGLTYALRYAVGVWRRGIGVSRREVYRRTGGDTPWVHSYSTLNRYAGVVKDFVRWAKERGLNRLDRVSEGDVMRFLEEKAEAGLSQRTLKVNATALKRFFRTVGREDIARAIEERYTEIYSAGRAPSRVQPLIDPEGVLEKLRGPHRVIAELQLLTGARVGDVKKITLDERNMQVVIQGSKGGRDRRIDFHDRPQTFSRIRGLLQERDRFLDRWTEIRRSYPAEVHRACVKAQEIYTGPHAFRVTYAVRRFRDLVASGIPEHEADRILTQELGHNRIQMSRYYRSY